MKTRRLNESSVVGCGSCVQTPKLAGLRGERRTVSDGAHCSSVSSCQFPGYDNSAQILATTRDRITGYSATATTRG